MGRRKSQRRGARKRSRHIKQINPSLSQPASSTSNEALDEPANTDQTEQVTHRSSWARRLINKALIKQEEEANTHPSQAHHPSENSVKQLISNVKQLTEENAEQLLGAWDYLIIVLSITSLGMLFVLLSKDLPSEIQKLIEVFDLMICGIFFVDFLLRLFMAPSKKHYLKWGWIDLISSLPMIDQLRVGRLFRVVRLVRAMKGAWIGTKKLDRRLQDPFISVALIAFICVIFGAISVLYLESGAPGGNIKSARDAIWWALVTVTTVGYGDFTPVTNEGRFLAVILMSAGIGIFGVFSVQCTQYLLREREKSEDEVLSGLREELKLLRTEVGELRSLILNQTQLHDPLNPLVDAQSSSKSVDDESADHQSD